jgi:hypothetical protein
MVRIAMTIALKRTPPDKGCRVPSGDRSEIPADVRTIVARATSFRIEADALRARAYAADEEVIRKEYLSLAERWSSVAAGLETEALDRAFAREQ